MDENTVRLLDLFRAYEPDAELKELLDDVKIFSGEVDTEDPQRPGYHLSGSLCDSEAGSEH